MPCKIKIRKAIDKSIAIKTDNDYQGFSEKSARAVAVSLNKLWGSIASIAQTSGKGDYKVVISRVDEAVDREYDRQLAAEKQFERDLSFFNDDQALYEQEQKETLDLTETLVKQYGVENINSNMLEGLGYTPEQIGKILKEIC
jgi:hypothetical protein